MSNATEFVSFTAGNVTVSGFVTPEDLARIESGGVVDVVIRKVVAVHGDVGEDVPLGDGHVQFIGGGLSPFPPAKGTDG